MKRLLLLIIIVPLLLHGETIYLKDGSKIIGKIISQNKSFVSIKTKYASIKVKKIKIKRISYKNARKNIKIIVRHEKEWANIYLMNGDVVSGSIIFRNNKILKIKTQKGIIKIKKKNIDSIDYHKNEKKVVKNENYFSTVKIGGLYKKISNFSGSISDIEMSSNGKFFGVVTEAGEISVYDTEKFNRIAHYQNRSGGINCIAFTKEGRIILTGGSDYVIRAFRINNKTLKEIKSFKGHKNGILDVKISDNKKYLISSSLDWSIRIWNFKSKKLLKVLKGHNGNVNSLALVMRNKRLVSADDKGKIYLWKFPSGRLLKKINAHNDKIVSISKGRDGYFISAAYDNKVKLWNKNSSTPQAIFTLHEDRITDAAFSGNNSLIASGSYDTTIKLYSILDIINNRDIGKSVEIKNSAVINKAHGYLHTLLISRDMKYLIGGGYKKEIKIWKIQTD